MASVKALLLVNNLPVEDLSSLRSSDFLYCGQRESPMGVIGLQTVGDVGLLRSLVVSQAARKQGCGTALVAAIESKAVQAGIADLYLLTETAERFFSNLQYAAIPRESAPSSIKETREFAGLCPDDAILMHKQFTLA